MYMLILLVLSYKSTRRNSNWRHLSWPEEFLRVCNAPTDEYIASQGQQNGFLIREMADCDMSHSYRQGVTRRSQIALQIHAAYKQNGPNCNANCFLT